MQSTVQLRQTSDVWIAQYESLIAVSGTAIITTQSMNGAGLMQAAALTKTSGQ